MKKFISILLIAMLAFSAAACGNKAGNGESDGVDVSTFPVITACLAEEPETMDPTLGSALDTGTYFAHLYEGLVTMDKDKNWVPGAAESWDVSDDGLVYTYHLREDAKWSDGEPVTAKDFVYSWTRLCDPELAASYSYFSYYINGAREIYEEGADPSTLGAKAIDDFTLEVTLDNPVVFFDQLMAFACFAPLRQDLIEQDPEGWTNNPELYVSNGPFKMAEWAHDEYVLVQKNLEYWNSASVSDVQVKFVLMADDNTIYASFETGDLLFADTLPVAQYDATRAAGTLTIAPELSTYYYSFNNEREYLKDPRVRQALTLAIDRQFLVDNVWKDDREVAGAQVGPGFTEPDGSDFRAKAGNYFDPSEAAYAANVEKAKQLMAEAGYPDGKGFPTLEFLTNDTQGHIDIAEAVQQMWKETLGVNMNIAKVEWGVFIPTRENGDFDVARDGWVADFEDPVTMLDLYMSNGVGLNNNPRYQSKAFDDFILKSREERDPAARMEWLHKAEEQMIGKDWAMAPIAYYADPYLVSPKLQGMIKSNVGYKYFTWAKVVE